MSGVLIQWIYTLTKLFQVFRVDCYIENPELISYNEDYECLNIDFCKYCILLEGVF